MSFWRTPPGWREGPQGASADDTRAWIAQQLASLPTPPGAPTGLNERIRIFQLSQGLPADGRAGPMTFMRLNALAAVAEPRLFASTDLSVTSASPGR